MKIDLGCGQYPRGDLNITIIGKGVVEKTPHLDRIFEKYGFYYRGENAEIINMSIEDFLETRISLENDDVLMSHILEHLICPAKVLERLYQLKVKTLIIEIPNARINNADWVDKNHIYSWTTATLWNLLSFIFKGYKIEIREEMNGQDIFAEVRRE